MTRSIGWAVLCVGVFAAPLRAAVAGEGEPRRVLPPNVSVERAAALLARHEAGSDPLPGERMQALDAYLRGKTDAELSAGLQALGFGDEVRAEKRVLLRYAFMSRGASESEARQQLMLQDRYQINTVVTPDNRLSMWPASTSPEVVRRVLAENQDLEPRVRGYLSDYIRLRDMHAPSFGRPATPKF